MDADSLAEYRGSAGRSRPGWYPPMLNDLLLSFQLRAHLPEIKAFIERIQSPACLNFDTPRHDWKSKIHLNNGGVSVVWTITKKHLATATPGLSRPGVVLDQKLDQAAQDQ
jgi:hypothetical protein